jgi:dTMP kinase
VSDTESAVVARSAPSGLAALFGILRIRPFRRLWIVLGVASLGDWLGLLATASFAQSQVTGATAKGAAFGGTIAVRLLPALVLGPVAGVLADRFDRRLTMVSIDLIRFVLFASIPAAPLFLHSPAQVVAWTAVATFLVEAVTMAWLPAKDASVPNLVPRRDLETANQLSLATTYGITPVAGALLLAAVSAGLGGYAGNRFLAPTVLCLYFLAFTRLATAGVVFFGIREISGHTNAAEAAARRGPGVTRQFLDGWAYVARTKMVRGLVFGILAAFGAGGMVVGSGQFYAHSLSGGDSAFYVLFAMIFVGLAIGIAAGPRLIGALSRRRWFGISIVCAGIAVGLMAFAWHLTIAVILALLVGVFAGMAFLAGTTLLGGETEDAMRGRAFAFVNMSTRVVLMLAIALASVLVGLGSERALAIGGVTVHLSMTRILLLLAGVLAATAGVAAFRQMDDKPGVPVLRDIWASLRGRPLALPGTSPGHGVFVVFEGGEGAGKSTQVDMLSSALRAAGYDVVVTREPGATEVGQRIRALLLDPGLGSIAVTPRAEALLYAADRAHHVASVVRPALATGRVVISDRYADSSLAYQGAGRTLPVDDVAWLSSWATGGLQPDLVVLLDVDPATGLARVAGRGSADRLEAENLAFHDRVRRAFLDLAAKEPKRYLVVDATEDVQAIATSVLERVRELLSPPEPPAAPTASANGHTVVPAHGVVNGAQWGDDGHQSANGASRYPGGIAQDAEAQR